MRSGSPLPREDTNLILSPNRVNRWTSVLSNQRSSALAHPTTSGNLQTIRSIFGVPFIERSSNWDATALDSRTSAIWWALSCL